MPPRHRLSAATGLHRGDRPYQQDQVELMVHPHVRGCLLGVVADGMGGKSGGRKASDQVVMTARQLFEQFAPREEDPLALLRQMAFEAHTMIKLTAMSAEEEPHSTIAAFLLMPDLDCHWVHTGDSRIYHFRHEQLARRTMDHSYVQKLIDEGEITEAEAATHPRSNLLTACLGTVQPPTPTLQSLGSLSVGDTLLACSDGLWHYITPREMGLALRDLPAREASEVLISKARQRAHGSGDNLSLVIVKAEPLA